MMIKDNILSGPILYPSFYFKKRRAEYYKRLDAVRTDGDFEGWIYFYLEAIKEGALDAHKRAKEVEALEQKLRNKFDKSKNFARINDAANQTLTILFQYPAIAVKDIEKGLGVSYNTAGGIINKFLEAKILVELEDKKRNKLFYFREYLDLLEKEY